MPKHKQILTAMSNTEDGVDVPSRRKSSSFAAAVADLELGESASRAVKIDNGYTIAEMQEQIQQWRSDFRNSTTPAVRRAKERNPAAEYSIEVQDVTTFSHNVFIVAIVTRTA